MPMVVRRKGWRYLGMMQNTWTTESQRLCQEGREMRPASPASGDLVLTGGPFACPTGLKTFGSTPFGFSLLPHPPTLVSHHLPSTPRWARILIGLTVITPYRSPGPALPTDLPPVRGPPPPPHPAPEPLALSRLASPQSTSLKGMST